MRTISNALGICFLFAILTLGCAEDGEPGPPGEKGDPGTANVVYSEWLESEFSTDVAYDEYQLVEIDTNQYSLNTTVFLLYGKTVNGVVYPLPRQINSTTYGYYVVPDFGTGLPARIMVYRDGNIPGGSSVPFHFRYVIIPGGVSTSGRMDQPDFDDYEEVKSFYNISD